MSYYTKYRPQTIESLDLTVARNSLLSILKSGKFSHAYLFTGPKGTGKTSSARILAKVLNCEKNKEHLNEPCNECDSCRRITNGSSLACLEMDAASNRGIDDIRTLKERIGLAPAEGKYILLMKSIC
jgi:DNA polymerase-3 subunit gamma/tau